VFSLDAHTVYSLCPIINDPNDGKPRFRLD
jgi:hypothetical protein